VGGCECECWRPRCTLRPGSLTALTVRPAGALRGGAGGWTHAKPRSREGWRKEQLFVGVFRVRGGGVGRWSCFRGGAGLWGEWPPHPRRLSPVSRGRGEEEWSVVSCGRLDSREAAKPRRVTQRAIVSGGFSSTRRWRWPGELFSGRSWVVGRRAPSPPTPLPRFTGARGGEGWPVVSCRRLDSREAAKPRSREGWRKEQLLVGIFRVRVRVPSARAD